jgi:hypothetical protein
VVCEHGQPVFGIFLSGDGLPGIFARLDTPLPAAQAAMDLWLPPQNDPPRLAAFLQWRL